MTGTIIPVGMAESAQTIERMTAMNPPVNAARCHQSTATHAKGIVMVTTAAVSLEMTAALVPIQRKGYCFYIAHLFIFYLTWFD